MNLEGRVVIVTGGGHGIGRATVLALAERGARVAVADLDEEGAAKVQATVEEAGGVAVAIAADVSKEDGVEATVQRAREELGEIDAAVLNAGVSVSGPAESTPVDDWRWVFDVNVMQHVYFVRRLLPSFKKRREGHLVHVASAAGILGTPGLAAYCASKHAVVGLAESLAVTLHGSGIGVSVVCPLWVNTDITDRGRITFDPDLGLEEEVARTMARELLRGAGIPPEQVAAAIVQGIEEQKFMILPHPEVLQFAQIKWSDPERYVERAAEALKVQRQAFGERSF